MKPDIFRITSSLRKGVEKKRFPGKAERVGNSTWLRRLFVYLKAFFWWRVKNGSHKKESNNHEILQPIYIKLYSQNNRKMTILVNCLQWEVALNVPMKINHVTASQLPSVDAWYSWDGAFSLTLPKRALKELHATHSWLRRGAEHWENITETLLSAENPGNDQLRIVYSVVALSLFCKGIWQCCLHTIGYYSLLICSANVVFLWHWIYMVSCTAVYCLSRVHES